jgi:hypothetical protein
VDRARQVRDCEEEEEEEDRGCYSRGWKEEEKKESGLEPGRLKDTERDREATPESSIKKYFIQLMSAQVAAIAAAAAASVTHRKTSGGHYPVLYFEKTESLSDDDDNRNFCHSFDILSISPESRERDKDEF